MSTTIEGIASTLPALQDAMGQTSTVAASAKRSLEFQDLLGYAHRQSADWNQSIGKVKTGRLSLLPESH